MLALKCHLNTYVWAILTLNWPCWLILSNSLSRTSFLHIPTLILRFNNRWRWSCGHFNFRHRPLKLGYLRSFIQIFFIFLILIFFLSFLGWSKLNIYCVFTELSNKSQDDYVGGILSNKSIRSPNLFLHSVFCFCSLSLMIGPY